MSQIKKMAYGFFLWVLLASALVCLFPRDAFAILDIESLRMKLHDQPYGGLLALSYERKEGNTDDNRLSASAQGLWKHNDVEYLATLSRDFGQSEGVRDTDRTVGHLRATWPSSAWTAVEAYAQTEQDQFRRLSDRELYGAGVREKLYGDDKALAYFGLGPLRSQETLNFVPGTTDTGTIGTWRANMYLSVRGEVAKNIALTVVSYYQPNLVQISDVRIFNDSELAFEANKNLSLSLVYQLIYESLPPQTVQSTDQTFGSVLKLKF